MKKSLLFASVLMFLTPVISKPQSSIDGTWKVDVNKIKMPDKPDEYLLKDGMYHCKTCVPSLEVKTDGQDHRVTGHPYYDTVNVHVMEDHTLEITRKRGSKTVLVIRETVSPDGSTLIEEFNDSTASTEPIISKGQSTRVAKGPAGGHAISGSWRASKVENVSDNGLITTFKVDSDTLTMTSPTGQSYTAKLDGTDAPYKGDPATTSVSVKRLSDKVFEETDKRDGKVTGVVRMIVSPDGKALTLDFTDKERGTTSQAIADKQ
jgi:hypothetical protein